MGPAPGRRNTFVHVNSACVWKTRSDHNRDAVDAPEAALTGSKRYKQWRWHTASVLHSRQAPRLQSFAGGNCGLNCDRWAKRHLDQPKRLRNDG